MHILTREAYRRVGQHFVPYKYFLHVLFLYRFLDTAAIII